MFPKEQILQVSKNDFQEAKQNLGLIALIFVWTPLLILATYAVLLRS